MSQLFSIIFIQFVPLKEIINKLSQFEVVQYAHQPIQVMPLIEPNDSLYNPTTQWNLYKINAEKAWNITKGTYDIEVGVVDPGCFHPSHYDLCNKFLINEEDPDTTGSRESHGTFVASVLGAETNNNIGIASLGWNLMMRPYSWSENDSIQYLANDIYKAADSVDIINCSFITMKDGEPHNYNEIQSAIENAINVGVVVVAGTGNRIKDEPFHPYPAAYIGVIGVAATDSNDEHFDNYNYQWEIDFEFIDVTAPGKNIKTCSPLPPNDSYTSSSGTSMSTPHVSALAGLILSINSTLTTSQIENIIEGTSKDLGNWSYYGHGRINAYQALKHTVENYGGTFTQDVTT